MAAVPGSKFEKLIYSILEELGLSRQEPTELLLCDNTAAIIMPNSKKPA